MEGGVDVPNASMMVIENAERLGLSQLHQLRGRVGRGNEASQCVLLYQSPLGETARARLETMRATTDGFAIAQRSEEHTSELQSLMRISYAVFCLKKKNIQQRTNTTTYKHITLH